MTIPPRAPEGDRLGGMQHTKVTNEDFAEAVGIHFTMASRLRNGERMPSVKTLSKIIEVYSLDPQEALDHYGKGSKHFSAFLRAKIFDIPTET